MKTETSMPASATEARPTIRLGIALSGGGFRATAYHLGVLKRLEELGLLPYVAMLSTVSGGSIAGATYALRCAQRGDGRTGSVPVDAVIDELVPVLKEGLRGPALFGTPWRSLVTLLSFVAGRGWRTRLMASALSRRIFHGARLRDLPDWIVLNATNLRTGKAWKFFPDRSGDFLAGATTSTATLPVADAVMASAAFPGLTDAFWLPLRWEELDLGLLDRQRWERPTAGPGGDASPWRTRFGRRQGAVRFPLVDGGVYDNEGVNSLRGARVTHAVVSSAAQPEADYTSPWPWARALRTVNVIHARLGAANRQLTHEMTHGEHPTVAADRARAAARDLEAMADDTTLPEATRQAVRRVAERVTDIVRVGTPPRGWQFQASAQLVLSRTDLAANRFADPATGAKLDTPERYRGLRADVVEDLGRVRTDLDALEPEVIELLLAHGYFLCDYLVKLTMPELLDSHLNAANRYLAPYAPDWPRAHAVVAWSTRDEAGCRSVLSVAARTKMPFGRIGSAKTRVACAVSLASTLVVGVVLVIWSFRWL
jgi:NTE family protein